MGSVPVWDVVDIALSSCGSDQVSMSDRKVNHSVFEVKMLFEFDSFGEDVRHIDTVLIIETGLPVVIANLLVDHLAEYDVTVSTGASTDCTIRRPD